VAGHAFVTLIPGLVANVHVTLALSETGVSPQLSLAVTMTLLLTEQVLAGAVKVYVKFAEAPGARETTVSTGVLGVGWLRVTTTLLRVTSPVLRTVPLKVMAPPAAAAVGGQASVMSMPGALTNGHVNGVELVTGVWLQSPVPDAVTLTVVEQVFAGAV
jgi:hypothetical protein